ncbi:MAG: hypothetical protein JSV44_08470 [Candidatus Zixiibacteriota bacterium]|nr:MAG: hypothetical protein JSV44_08470 [candidate division Zixibacteria bacterium]
MIKYHKITIAVLLIILLSGNPSLAVEFRVEFTNQSVPGTVAPNTEIEIEIYMHNTFGEGKRDGYSLPLEISGEAQIEWLNRGGPTMDTHPDFFGGGFGTGGALEIVGDFGPGGAFFPFGMSGIYIFSEESWDGVLPDTFNHTAICWPNPVLEEKEDCGWPDTLGEQLVYVLHLNTGLKAGEICIDSIGHANPTFDWLWSPSSGPFGGPYCITVFNCCQAHGLAGDANSDNDINLLDILLIIDFVYQPPIGDPHNPDGCDSLLDANGDTNINLLDILYLISHVYGIPAGPAPVCP